MSRFEHALEEIVEAALDENRSPRALVNAIAEAWTEKLAEKSRFDAIDFRKMLEHK